MANELIRLDILDEIRETIMLNIGYLLRHQIVPKFWKYFNVENDMENGFYQFQLSVYELHQEYEKFKKILRRSQMLKIQLESDQNHLHEFNELLKVTLLSQLPADFTKIVYSFYHTSFKVFANSHQDNGECTDQSDFQRCRFIFILICPHPVDRRRNDGRSQVQWMRQRVGQLPMPGAGVRLQ